MKKKWFRTMDLVDEEYILEADPGQRVSHIGRKRVITTVLASCACLALVLSSLWLFTPYSTTPPSAMEYKDSAYFPVIRELSKLSWEKPKYDNNFQKYMAQLTGLLRGGVKGDAMLNGGAMEDAGAALPEMAPGVDGELVFDDIVDGSSGTGETYEEVTDNQVEGITEADRIKRSSTHIYYLDEGTLRIFTIEGEASREVGYYRIHNLIEPYRTSWAFYLSEDCKTVTVVANYKNSKGDQCVGVISLDVSNPKEITEKNRFEITGEYASSRVTGGKLLLITEFSVNKNMLNFNREESFLPQINGACIEPSQIVLPEEVTRGRYTVVTQLDENTLAMDGIKAFLSYSTSVYVSHDHIFLTHVYADEKKVEEYTVRNSMTEITCLTYKDAFEQKGTAVVRGYVKDQWSMDEYEGILRVVTTTNATTIRETYWGDTVSAEILTTATGNSNASLYCIDLQTFETVASVEDFAPPKEEVQSVRFDKDTAYVCTSIEMSDPVFFFDLSDLNNITYKDTGTIEGFSTSLVNFGNGYLLGIGRENWDTFKIEIYQETEDGVTSLCKYTSKNTQYGFDYKSYYIDRENQLVGLGVYQLDRDANHSRYILLHFDGYNLVELLNVELPGENACKRGVYIDGFMYMFGRETFKVEKVF